MSELNSEKSCRCLLKLETEALREKLPSVVEMVISPLTDAGWSGADLNRIELVLEEAMLNVALHGYKGNGGELLITLESVSDGSLSLTLSDSAAPFDPLHLPVPDGSVPVEQRTIGGLGVHLIRSMCEEVSYRYHDGHNILQMVFFPRI